MKPSDYNRAGMLQYLGLQIPQYTQSNNPPASGAGGYIDIPQRPVSVAPVINPCAFGYVYTHDSHTWLQGGQVSGGIGTFSIDELDLGLTSSLPTSGYCFVRIDYIAEESSGVLLPGGYVSSVTYTAHSATPPLSNKMPTASDPTGYIYVILAVYAETGVSPSSCGNILVTHCPGTLQAFRDSFTGEPI